MKRKTKSLINFIDGLHDFIAAVFMKAVPYDYASGVGEAKSDDFTVTSCQISGHLSGDPLHPFMTVRLCPLPY